jgi:hypothetical protein
LGQCHLIKKSSIDGVTVRPWRGRKHDCSNFSGPEGEPVIGPSGPVWVMVATKPVDFRKGAEE